MSYRDLAEAAEALYGDKLYGMHLTASSDLGPVREDDDLAEAWLNGDRARVEAAVAAHAAEVRARVVIVKSSSKKRRILELRKRGWTSREISAEVKTTGTYVARTCRLAGAGRVPSKVNRSRLREMRDSGMKLTAIAEAEHLNVATVCRVLRGKQ